MEKKLQPKQCLIIGAINTGRFIKEIQVLVTLNETDFKINDSCANRYHLQSKIDELQGDIEKLLSKYFDSNRIEANDSDELHFIVTNMTLGI